MKKQLFSVLMIGALLSSTLYANAAFTDVSTSTQTKLDYLISKGVVSSESTTFRPADVVNRAESLKLILAASQLTLDMTATNSTFKDVVADSWYAPYVNTGVKFGIVRGYEDGTLRPEQKVNKGEFVTMLYRMHTTLRSAEEPSEYTMQYLDVKSTDWYAKPASWAKTFLEPAANFEASKDLSREETASIVYSYMTHFKVEKNLAFGVLDLTNAGAARPESGGGGMGLGANSSGSGAVMTESGTTMPDMKEPGILPYPYYSYKTEYEYTGPALEDYPASVDVVKAINTPTAAISIPGFFGDLSTVASVFSSMGNIELGYMTFTPAVKDGFMYSIDKLYGSFGINIDWRNQVYPADMPLNSEPVDSEIVAIANKFLADKGISTAGYGAPVVDKSWKLYRTEGDMSYIPDYYTVNYPKMVQNSPVYGLGGYYDQSLTVSVMYSSKTVTAVNGYLPKLEVTSQYSGKKWDTIRAEAEKGGVYGVYRSDTTMAPEGSEVITQTTKVTLTSARKVMMAVYNYNKIDEKGNPTLHYVPAVLFSGTSVTTSTDGSADYTNPDVKVMVPAVEDAELNIQMNY